jgi:hypothetical protein
VSRPPDIRIDDWSAPRHAPHVLAIFAEAEKAAPQLRLDADVLCAQAQRETGLTSFGDESVRERVAAHLHACEAEGRLSAMGKLSRYSQTLQWLKSRLLVEDVIARHPRVLENEVARPIFITGFPRTGTTHLHNTLAADPELRALPYWEACEPVLAERERPAPGAPDPRVARTEAALGFVNGALPHFLAMHEMTVDHAHEEIDLLALDFSTMYLETPGPLRSWSDAYKRTDQTPHYKFLKRALQVLSFLRGGGKRWVLKSPQHLEQLPVLQRVFPDATIVLTHRDPLPIVASMATMWTYTARLAQERPDPLAYGAYTALRIEDLLRACVRDRASLDPARALDVPFQLVRDDPDGAVERVYAKAGQPLSGTSRAAIVGYTRAHPPGRHGRVLYDLADFGLDARALRERFRAYTDRFAVPLEM